MNADILTVCVCVVITFSRLGVNRVYGCQSCLWSADQGKRNFPCPRSHLRVWSRELGWAVPSRVSLFILHTQAESGAYSKRLHFPFPLRLPLEPSYAIGLVPSLSGHAIALPMAFTTTVTQHRAISSQGSSISGSFLFRQPHGLNNIRPSFPTPATDTVGMCFKEGLQVIRYVDAMHPFLLSGIKHRLTTDVYSDRKMNFGTAITTAESNGVPILSVERLSIRG